MLPPMTNRRLTNNAAGRRKRYKLEHKLSRTDSCSACGSEDLFSGYFDLDDLAVSEDTGEGVRWTTFCNQCGTEQA